MTVSAPISPAARLLRGLRRWLPRALLVALIGYLALLASLYPNQERLLFHPQPLPADFSFVGRYAPEQAFEEIRIPVEGAVLDGLLPALTSSALVLVTYRPEYEGALAGRPGSQTIALAPLDERARTDAAVALPAVGEVYRSDTVTMGPRRDPSAPIRITASANRPPRVLFRMADFLDFEMVRIGSAGAKAMAVVRGDVDAYLHAGGQWEWDSAAPAGVVLAAGMHASRLDGSPMLYNRPDPYLPDLLMCRPELADTLLEAIRTAGGPGGPRYQLDYP